MKEITRGKRLENNCIDTNNQDSGIEVKNWQL